MGNRVLPAEVWVRCWCHSRRGSVRGALAPAGLAMQSLCSDSSRSLLGLRVGVGTMGKRFLGLPPACSLHLYLYLARGCPAVSTARRSKILLASVLKYVVINEDLDNSSDIFVQ